MSALFPMTVPINMQSYDILIKLPTHHVKLLKVRKIMKTLAGSIGLVPGICVLSVTLLSGCATGPTHQPMDVADLNEFRIDCSKRNEQLKFLNSQLSNPDDQLMARVKNLATPWTAVTDPEARTEQRLVGSGYSNWMLRHLIAKVRYYCG
jgi:outer membrane murein-binding lipoprotein Lpp